MSTAARLALACLLLAAAPAAHAQSADQTAADLQARLRAWIAGFAPPALDLGSRQVTVTPEGDGFRFELPLAGPVTDTGWTITAGPVTAQAKPLEAGRWAIESLQLPSPLQAAGPSLGKHGMSEWKLELLGQDVHGTFDPSLASASSFDAALRGYTSNSKSGQVTQTTHFDHYTLHAGWQPAGDRRVTLSSEAEGERLSMAAIIPEAPGRLVVTAAAMHSSAHVEKLDFDRLGVVLRNLGGLMPTLTEAARSLAKPDSLSPEARARLRDLVMALRDLMGGVQQSGRLQQITLDAGPFSGSAAALEGSAQAKATGGLLDASLRLDIDGIDTPMVQDRLRDYLPRRIVLAPHVSGVPLDDLMALLLRGLDNAALPGLEQEAEALLAKGPLKLALDELRFDLGAALLNAAGAVTIAGTNDIAASAHVAVTGLDALIKAANTIPELQSATPMLIFAKGIGEQKGDTTNWTIAYADGRATVNGADLSAMMGGNGNGNHPTRPRGHGPIRPRQ